MLISVYQALLPDKLSSDSMPATIPDIALLNSPESEAPTMIANSLWFRYRAVAGWGKSIWQSSFLVVRGIATQIDQLADMTSITSLGRLLVQIDHHIPLGLKTDIMNWLIHDGHAALVRLSNTEWQAFIELLRYLVHHNVIDTSIILAGIIHPAWKIGASEEGSDASVQASLLQGALLLFDFLQSHAERDECESEDPYARSQPENCFDEPHFTLLVATIPLMTLMELNEAHLCNFRRSVERARRNLCHSTSFRNSLSRNAAAVRQAFEPFLLAPSFQPHKRRLLMDALRVALYGAAPGKRPCYSTRVDIKCQIRCSQ